MQALKKKYRDHKDVLICDSFPSIEYWFLLHYVDTCKSFSSAAVGNELSKHVSGYCKDMEWAKREHWVASLRADGREQAARERAAKYAEDSEQYSDGKSYTNLYKFFDKYPPKA